MVSAAHATQGATLRDYLHVVRRRKWIILLAVVLVPAAAVVFSLREQPLYRASAQVLLSTQNLAGSLTGTQAAPPSVQAEAEVARVAAVARRAVRGTGVSAAQLLGESSVSGDPTTDILTFAVTAGTPALAAQLVNAYASAYTVYRRQLDTVAIKHALAGVDMRLKALAKAGDRKSASYTSLEQHQQTLLTMAALETSNASVLQRAAGAAQTQPRTKRDAILALMLGLVLGIGLALLWEALDTRVRSGEEIAERLGGLPLLARVPEPDKRLRARNGLVMLEQPSGTQAESFRMLRTNLEFVTLERDVRTIMVTSSVEQEGKSTTAANLAIAMARAGQRVALVDLDLRRPFLDRFFDLRGPGVTGVALGLASLEQALVPVAITDADQWRERHGSFENGNGNGNGARHLKGVLEVLPSGAIPPDPGEFVGTQALGDILEALRERADVVLIDAPPVLHVGDATALSAKVDGILVVTCTKVVRRHLLGELGRQLATVPTPVLGVVIAGAEDEEEGYGYAYHPRPYEPLERHHVRSGA